MGMKQSTIKVSFNSYFFVAGLIFGILGFFFGITGIIIVFRSEYFLGIFFSIFGFIFSFIGIFVALRTFRLAAIRANSSYQENLVLNENKSVQNYHISFINKTINELDKHILLTFEDFFTKINQPEK